MQIIFLVSFRTFLVGRGKLPPQKLILAFHIRQPAFLKLYVKFYLFVLKTSFFHPCTILYQKEAKITNKQIYMFK